ncbi:MAG: ABC transporter ATP-binding protein [Gammaproteobacteria bacterium]
MQTNDTPRAAVEVENLVSHYGERQTLHGVDVSVANGEISVIMGRSGSGKSTLLRHLLGLKRPTSGAVRVLGRDMVNTSQKELFELRKSIGVAFQHGALINSMNVFDNVTLPLRQHTRLDENTIRIICRMKLEMMNLAGSEELMPAELSGGMLKRAGLARAVVMDPKLLFFDEPSSGLDPITSVELDELILRLRDAMRMTIVVVTHELESALKIADRITVLEDGKALIAGTVEHVRASNDDRVQDMLQRRPRTPSLDADEYLERLTDASEQS